MSLRVVKAIPEAGFYYHYKHDPAGSVNNYAYEVLGVGFHTEHAREGEEHFVVYRPLYESAIYNESKKLGVPCFDCRPLEMWMGTLRKGDTTIKRFEKIDDPSVLVHLLRIRAEMY